MADIIAYLLNLSTPTPTVPEAIQTQAARITGRLPSIVENLPEGDPERGEWAFGPEHLACDGCHTLDGRHMEGPTLLGVADRVPPGYDSVEAYLVEAIWVPQAYIVPGFGANPMPDYYEKEMNTFTLANVIAYILSVD